MGCRWEALDRFQKRATSKVRRGGKLGTDGQRYYLTVRRGGKGKKSHHELKGGGLRSWCGTYPGVSLAAKNVRKDERCSGRRRVFLRHA